MNFFTTGDTEGIQCQLLNSFNSQRYYFGIKKLEKRKVRILVTDKS